MAAKYSKLLYIANTILLIVVGSVAILLLHYLFSSFFWDTVGSAVILTLLFSRHDSYLKKNKFISSFHRFSYTLKSGDKSLNLVEIIRDLLGSYRFNFQFNFNSNYIIKYFVMQKDIQDCASIIIKNLDFKNFKIKPSILHINERKYQKNLCTLENFKNKGIMIKGKNLNIKELKLIGFIIDTFTTTNFKVKNNVLTIKAHPHLCSWFNDLSDFIDKSNVLIHFLKTA